MDWFPVWLSLRVSLLATVLTAIIGVPAAWWLVHSRFAGKQIVSAVMMTPLVLPPTVLGYYLLLLISRYGPVGRVLDSAGIELAFTWRAAVVAAAVGSFPLLFRAAQAGFESVDRQLEDAARTLGRHEWNIFWSVSAPLARDSIVAGMALAFCRAFGDFGITLMVAGNIPGQTQTLSLAVYDAVQAGHDELANFLVVLTSVVCVLILVASGKLLKPHH